MDATQPDAVYELVTSGFADLGASDPRCISRSFLLRNTFYAGQVFRCEKWQAVWLHDNETVKFYDAAGNLVKTVGLAVEMVKKAA